jgi:hypothetical protein
MKKNLLFTVISLFFLTAYSQQESGIWTTISIDKKLKKWEFSAETDLRTIGGNDIYYVRLIDRWAMQFSADYQILKPLKVGLSYQIMDKLDTKYANYQWRHRANFTVSGKQKWGDFSFSLRERIQFTTKDDSKRIRPNGEIDTYKVKNDFTWRNRFQVSYDIPNCKITPAASVETFYQMNNPDGNKLETIRLVMSFNYKINKRNAVEAYSHFNRELLNTSDEMYGIYVFGLTYKYSLK